MAEGLSDLFKNLKAGILGTKTLEIDKKIDDSMLSIQKHTSKSEINPYMETMKSLVSNIGLGDVGDVLKDLNNTTGIETFNQGDRLNRYKEYDAIVSNIAYCQRALKVLTDNILSPDDITKRHIQFLAKRDESLKEVVEYDTVISRLKEISLEMNLENFTDRFVLGTLKKGDFFIEIIHSPKGQNSLSIVTEGLIGDSDNLSIDKVIDFNITIEEHNTSPKTNRIIQTESTKQGKITIYEYGTYDMAGGMGRTAPSGMSYTTPTSVPFGSSSRSKADGGKSFEPEDPHDKFKSKHGSNNNDMDELDINTSKYLKDLFLTFHDPKHVIRLETQRFRTCLGYLVFPKVDVLRSSLGFSSVSANDVDSVCMDIIKALESKLKTGKDKLSRRGDLRDVVSRYLKEVQDDEDLQIRYVPPELMCHWRINNEMFDPYGESIFESVKFDCKLLMAMKTANTIKRLTHATDKRVIGVELGLPRNATNLVEMMKEGMKKRKISVDSFGSVDTIPSHISTFEDIYLPMKDGKKFVEFDQIQFGSNPSEDIESMKFIRDNIVANLDVPPAFIGLEENQSNRSLLTLENVLFARTVVSYQKKFSILLKSLFDKIYTLLYPQSNDLDYIDVTFPPPKSGPYEHESDYIDKVGRIIESLSQLGIPKEYLKKKYLPDFDWEEVEKYLAREKIRTELGEQTDEEKEAQGGMGGFGGGFGTTF